MSLQKTRPTVDALQRIISSFKQFEKKLDKLQDDVSFHGQTLNDLRSMVVSLSAGTLSNPDVTPEEEKCTLKKTAAIQYDRSLDEPLIKTRRKNALQAFPAKVMTRSFQGKNRKYEMPFPSKLNATPKLKPDKIYSHKSLRPSKTEAPRKATMMRTGKNLVKKRSKMQKTQLL